MPLLTQHFHDVRDLDDAVSVIEVENHESWIGL